MNGFDAEQSIKLRMYLYRTKHLQIFESNRELFDLFSPKMRGDIYLKVNDVLTRTIHFFQGIELECLVNLMEKLQPLVLVPTERATTRCMYHIEHGRVLYRGYMIGPTSTWGTDCILENPSLRRFAGRALSHVELQFITREDVIFTCDEFPTAESRVRWAAVRTALTRMLIDLGDAARRKTLDDARKCPKDLEGTKGCEVTQTGGEASNASTTCDGVAAATAGGDGRSIGCSENGVPSTVTSSSLKGGSGWRLKVKALLPTPCVASQMVNVVQAAVEQQSSLDKSHLSHRCKPPAVSTVRRPNMDTSSVCGCSSTSEASRPQEHPGQASGCVPKVMTRTTSKVRLSQGMPNKQEQAKLVEQISSQLDAKLSLHLAGLKEAMHQTMHTLNTEVQSLRVEVRSLRSQMVEVKATAVRNEAKAAAQSSPEQGSRWQTVEEATSGIELNASSHPPSTRSPHRRNRQRARSDRRLKPPSDDNAPPPRSSLSEGSACSSSRPKLYPNSTYLEAQNPLPKLAPTSEPLPQQSLPPVLDPNANLDPSAPPLVSDGEEGLSEGEGDFQNL